MQWAGKQLKRFFQSKQLSCRKPSEDGECEKDGEDQQVEHMAVEQFRLCSQAG